MTPYSNKVAGNILKMKTSHQDLVKYELPLSSQMIPLSDLVGRNIKLSFDGQINCIHTGQKIKKSYNNGYSYEAFIKLAECDMCIMKPELCHFAKGTCRDEAWAQTHCMQPHIIYVANSSGVKVGITRKSQIPTRFMDQGAVAALPMFEVKDRLTSGLIEVEIGKFMSDKTNWRKMLQEGDEAVDLIQIKQDIINHIGEFLDSFDVEDLPEEVLTFNYPVQQYLSKITSLSFDKKPIIEGKLIGIKGQYLILDAGVLNMRKHQGYFVALEW
jgi:hypothetical protein